MSLDWIIDRRGAADPVMDQGARPTCLSCATSYAHGFTSSRSKSIEFLHYTSRFKANGAGTFESVRDVLADEGQPPESQWPYDPAVDDLAAMPPAHIPGPFANGTLAIGSEVGPEYLTAELEAGSLPVIGLVTTRRFMLLKDEILTERDTHLNRHAVLLVGAAIYTGPDLSGLAQGDTLLCIQNSWGPTWGVDGFGLIGPRAWSDLALVSAVLSGG